MKHFKIKKFFCLFSSRLFYLFVGFGVAIMIYVAQAALNHVSSGQPLTAQMWNDLLDASIHNGTPYAVGGLTRHGLTTCPAGSYMCGLLRHADGNWDETQIYCCNFVETNP